MSILIYIKLLNSMDSHKHRSQEKLSMKKKFLWLLVNLIILVTDQNLSKKIVFNVFIYSPTTVNTKK